MLTVKRSRIRFTKKFFFCCFFILAVGAMTFYIHKDSRTPFFQQEIKTLEQQLVPAGIAPNGISPINHPVFESIAKADQYLLDSNFGVVVEAGTTSRFYPYQILVWHEVVNDIVEGIPLVITYSPLTYTKRVFERTIEDVGVVEFGVDEHVLDNHLVLFDNTTHSLWSQMLEKGISGTQKNTPLLVYTSLFMKWETFKDLYPLGEVLSREADSTNDYTNNPYGTYATSTEIFFPLSHIDGRRKAKDIVYGIKQEGKILAIPQEFFLSEEKIFLDDFSLSVTPMSLEPAFWFSWSATYPQTELYE